MKKRSNVLILLNVEMETRGWISTSGIRGFVIHKYTKWSPVHSLLFALESKVAKGQQNTGVFPDCDILSKVWTISL